MEKELFFKILEQENKTKKECEKYFKNGTIIYREEEKNDFINDCIGGLMDEEEAEQEWERLDKTKFEGNIYRIDYVV